MKRYRHAWTAQRRGALVVLFSILLVVLVAILALTIDVGYLYTVRTDLQRASDAGALAGAGQLMESPAAAVAAAREYTRKNFIGTHQLRANDVDVELGQWDPHTQDFVPGLQPFDAVRVQAQRPQTPTFFAGVLGRNHADMKTDSIAVIRPRDIMLVLDYSGSMNEQNKISALKDAVQIFLNYLRENAAGIDRVGFVVYSTNAEMLTPLTFDFDQVEAAVMARPADGFTNIGQGIQLAREEIEHNARPVAQKLIVLMTDGLANRPLNTNPKAYVISEAHLAADANVPMATISFAQGADTQLMGQVALITNGTHFHVAGSAAQQKKELRSVFLRIAKARPAQLVE